VAIRLSEAQVQPDEQKAVALARAMEEAALPEVYRVEWVRPPETAVSWVEGHSVDEATRKAKAGDDYNFMHRGKSDRWEIASVVLDDE
jgi:hypothetical protein